jgi:hypothetical protein
MYCPSCGLEDRQLSQYCRTCGTDLRVVRSALDHRDEITPLAMMAREKVVVSPEEKRSRRVRTGVIMSTVGLAATIGTLLMVIATSGRIIPGLITFSPFLGLWLILLFAGLGVMLNGLFFTLPRKQLPGDAADALPQRALDQDRVVNDAAPSRTNELRPATQIPASITEHTTHHLTTSKP